MATRQSRFVRDAYRDISLHLEERPPGEIRQEAVQELPTLFGIVDEF